MIITKAHLIKKLESDIVKLNDEIRISNMIIFHQTQVIDTLKKKIQHQCKEIKILLKRMNKDVKRYDI